MEEGQLLQVYVALGNQAQWNGMQVDQGQRFERT
jgi:hypothetical protein